MAHSVEIKELINGIQITETLDGNIVINEFSYQAKPFIRSTNETDEDTYQIIDKVGEHYNIPALATEFVLIDIKGSVYIPADGAELIENSLKLRPFRPDNEPDEFHIGEITTTSNSLTITLPSDNVNWAKIGGVFYEKYYPDTFNFIPVATYQKILIVYAKPDSQVFYLAQGAEALEAVAPTYDGLFVAWILVTVAGSTIDTGERPPFVPLSGTLALHPVTGPIIGSEEFDKEANRNAFAQISDVEDAVGDLTTDDVPEGSNLYFTAAKVLATVLTGISFVTGTAVVSTDTVLVAFGKLQKQIIDALASISGKLDKPTAPNNVNTKVILGDGSTKNLSDIGVDSSSLVDKMHAYWDASVGKLVSSGLKFVAGAINQLEFVGRIKADAIILPNNTNPAIANRLRSDGSRLKYADDSAVEKDVAYLSDLQSREIKRVVHSGNQEIYISAIDYTTGYVTTTVPHGLTGFVYPVGLITNDFAINNTRVYNARVIPYEYRTATTFLRVINSNTLSIRDGSNNVIAVNTALFSNSGQLDISKWHIEVFVDFNISGISPGIKRFEVQVYGMAGAIPNNQRNYNLKLYDEVGTGEINTPIYIGNGFSSNTSRNAAVFSTSLLINTANRMFSTGGYENSFGGPLDDGFYTNFNLNLGATPLIAKNSGIKAFSGTGLANGGIITIYI